MNLAELQLIIQLSFNWYEQHLHAFQIGGASFGPFVEELSDTIENEKLLTIAHILAANVNEFSYEYDFGDSWLHRIEIVGTEPLSEDNSKPRCVAGERAGPLEDVGGIHGYHEIVKVLATPNHPDRNNLIECVAGEDFNPDYFSVDETNEKLSRYRWRTPWACLSKSEQEFDNTLTTGGAHAYVAGTSSLGPAAHWEMPQIRPPEKPTV